jgi:branched-chain amino acid aminotransferase
LLIGVGPQIGVKPADEFLFMVFVMPVGPYFKEGFKPTDYVIYREYDRAAPQGTGNIKVGGNYAASLNAGVRAHKEGYSAVLYLDAREKKYLDECGPANFFGIKGNSYITPKSNSILPSITNKSLRQLAKDMGMTVEERRIPVEELAEFSEAGACGTAAVVSPVRSVYDANKDIRYMYGDEPGEVCQKLYNKLINIQYGCEEDLYGWVTIVE